VSVTATTVGAARASAAGGSGCTGYDVGGQGWAVQCGTSNGGGGGGGGGGGADACTYVTLQQAVQLSLISQAVANLYEGTAPKGYIYLVQNCPYQFGFGPPAITLYADGGKLTPQALADQAYGELQPPTLAIATAPIGREGLVGLPEWFWVSTTSATEFDPMSVTVGPIGGVWATVTATPGPLIIYPGDGKGPVSCPAPGTPYNTTEPASSQQSACTVLYTQPSAGQPGNVFRVTISVTWTASWVGSGGTGGTLAPITKTATIGLPIAQAETVYTGGGA
jgi:hypothetical protein